MITAPVIAIIGPTASGKSALAMAIAARWPVEVISMDSAQVYRGMNIGTAKPSEAERAHVPHHLIDLIDPTESYSAARFCDDARAAITAIVARGRTPLIVGGTMLYFKALREGIADLPQADPTVRAAIDVQARERGWPAMHAELALVDPDTAARLAPNDAQRIQRALEIYRTTGRSMSALLREHSPTHEGAPMRIHAIALAPSDRKVLHERIALRFDAMLAAGLVEEVIELHRRFQLDAALPSMRAVGYRQVLEYLEGQFDRRELRERGIAATRQFAKRQLTWLRATPDCIALDCLAPDLEAQALAAIDRVNPGA